MMKKAPVANNGMMTDKQIEEILWRCSVTRRHFLQCYPSDKIPPKETLVGKYPVSMVINMDPEKKEGYHWVAIFLPNASTALYWDSLTLWPPPATTIFNFLQQFAHTERNKHPYQSPLTNVCGQHCIVFLYHMSLGYSFDKFLRLMESNHTNHDSFVHTFVKKLTTG